MLIARGPSPEALIASPIMRAMESGTLARFEEITRCASEVQDAMISILSEKTISIPELKSEVPAKRGFSIIATANTRDKGVNDMSAALKRRFNIIVLPTPKTIESEIEIVAKRVRELASNLELRAKCRPAEAIRKSGHDFSRAAHRPDPRRQSQAQDPQRRPLHRRGDLRPRPTAWPWPATSAAAK
jgi:MoxR-like ATPase